MINKLTLLFLVTVITVTVAGCGGTTSYYKPPDYSNAPAPFPRTGVKTMLDDSTLVYDIDPGKGDFTVHLRDQVYLKYTVRKPDSTILESSYYNGYSDPALISLKNISNQYLQTQGFREGILGMKEGGKRKLVVPPASAFLGSGYSFQTDSIYYDLELIYIASQ